MLSLREKQILLKLKHHDLTGDELSTQLGISRRTIIREIKSINEQLRDAKIGRIITKKNYHLEVTSLNLLTKLINQSDPDEYRVLLFLLLNKVISMDDLCEETFLSKVTLKSCLDKLAQLYKDFFVIKIRRGKGISLSFTLLTSEDILASLMLEFPHLQLLLQEFAEKHLNESKFIQLKNKFDLDKVISTRKELQVKAVAVSNLDLKSVEIEEQILKFFYSKKKLINELKSDQTNIFNLIAMLMKRYSFYNAKIIPSIFAHILRSSSFPDVVQVISKSDFQKLYLQDPFVFDFSQDLTQALKKKFPQMFISQKYLALYALLASKERETCKQQRILLFSDRNSLASLNKMIIEKNISDAECITESNINTFENDKRKYDLILVNTAGHFEASKKVDYFFNGLLNQDQIKHIKGLYSNKIIGQIISQQLHENGHILHLKVHSLDEFLTILNNGLNLLVKRNLILRQEKAKLVEREQQGNQLVTET